MLLDTNYKPFDRAAKLQQHLYLEDKISVELKEEC